MITTSETTTSTTYFIGDVSAEEMALLRRAVTHAYLDRSGAFDSKEQVLLARMSAGLRDDG